LQEGILFKFKERGSKCKAKYALYKSKLVEYQPNIYNGTAFQINFEDNHSIVLRTDDQMETQTWINAILRQRLLINEVIDSIEYD
jgi:hypothetical protein